MAPASPFRVARTPLDGDKLSCSPSLCPRGGKKKRRLLPLRRLLLVFRRPLSWIAAQYRIEVLDPKEVRTNRHTLHRAAVIRAPLRRIPRTPILLPLDLARGRGKIDVHVGAPQVQHNTPLGHASPRRGTMHMNSKLPSPVFLNW